MKKAITPVISIIILLLITISLAGAGWTYLGGYYEAMTAKQIKLVFGSGMAGEVMITNVGTADIEPRELRALVNGQEVSVANTNPIEPKKSTVISIAQRTCRDILDSSGKGIRIMGPANSLTYKQPEPESGAYWIDPDGPGSLSPIQTYCDMQTSGGGWTLVGKYDRDYSASWVLPSGTNNGWGRSQINLADMPDIATFSGDWASIDARDIIRNGAEYIMNIGDDDGRPQWDLVAILNIPADIQADPTNIWDSQYDSDSGEGCHGTCVANRIITYYENFTEAAPGEMWSCSLSSRTGVQDAANSFWSTCSREGATFSNAGNSDCTGTSDDTVYWCFQEKDGGSCGYGCCHEGIGEYKLIGTGCSSADDHKPTHRYNLMFMR